MGFSELARERQKLSEKNEAPVKEPKADKPVDPAGQVKVDLSDPAKVVSTPVVAEVKAEEPAPAKVAPKKAPAPAIEVVAPAAPAPEAPEAPAEPAK